MNKTGGCWWDIDFTDGGSGSWGTEYDIVYLGDFNGDGRTVCLRRRAQMGIGRCERRMGGTGFTSTASGSWGTVYGEMYPADFNGDGRTDFYPKSERLLANKTGGCWWDRLYWWRIGLIGGTEYDIVYLGDFNGDGRTDLFTKKELKMVLAGANGGCRRTGFTSTASGSWGTVYDEIYLRKLRRTLICFDQRKEGHAPLLCTMWEENA